MIRNFDLFCNLNRIIKSDFSLFLDSVNSLSPFRQICPSCGAIHTCSLHAHYNRDMIALEDSLPKVYSVSVPRLLCSSCGHTHAFLPACLIPYGSYSLFFILTVLRLYFLRSYTVENLCIRFSISVSTLYAWIHLFSRQKSLWLGVLKDSSTSSLGFLSLLWDWDLFLEQFFLRSATSFLQPFRFTAYSGLP